MLSTIGLVIASSIVGLVLLRLQSFGLVTRIRRDIEAKRDPSREMVQGAMILLAGILLLIPGFVTDIIGLLLFIPPVRELAWRFLRRRVNFSADFVGMGRGFGGRGAGRGKTIDLDADDYSKDADPNSPWRRIDRE